MKMFVAARWLGAFLLGLALVQDGAVGEGLQHLNEAVRLAPNFGDAWLNLAFSDAAQLRIGHFKKPFSRLELMSSTRILPIEHGGGAGPVAASTRSAAPPS